MLCPIAGRRGQSCIVLLMVSVPSCARAVSKPWSSMSMRHSPSMVVPTDATGFGRGCGRGVLGRVNFGG
jgi:hypothetical protein